MTRWVIIGCVGVSLLCCCGTIASLFLVDALCLWNRVPLLGDLTLPLRTPVGVSVLLTTFGLWWPNLALSGPSAADTLPGNGLAFVLCAALALYLRAMASSATPKAARKGQPDTSAMAKP